MGGEQGMDVLLMDPVFRNTRLALYITSIAASPDRRGVQIYRRCLYCKAGDAGVHRLYRWSLDTGVPRNVDHFSAKYKEDFNGHRFRVVTLAYFPYINYVSGSDLPGTAVRLTDSLNTRMMEASQGISTSEDGLWGLRTPTGNWTGTVGTLQHEKADFSMDITLTPQRTAVLDFCRVYIDEDISILSLKPRPLPEYLSLVRPFEGTVWVAVVVGTMVWSTALWLLMSIKRNTSEKNLLNLSSSLFYGWGLLLEDQPYHPPAFSPGQLMVGVWLIACLILRASYTCSLISHLVVQGKSEPINSLEELVRLQKSKGWEWGTRTFDGAFNSLLTISTNQDYHIVKAHMQTMDMSTGIRRVMDGGFSYMRNYYAIRILKETYHSREAGDNPFHISTARYPLFAGNTWAFRRGTPFITRFDGALQRYLDSGLITHWMDDVISKHIREERQEKKATSLTTSTYAMTDGGEVVLGLQHLQATFYILILGLAAASSTFILEQVAGRRFSSSAERLGM
ncbi:probable glutamate receptor [Portunus trituberculatus]|uniref:probable glutamate receptor n=1 Tax=Portunus trituberculatus TaxID=210409 RepID=UPI001E1CB6DA|nr:probable glutamate receptor [Portunus trituberculatus]